MRLTRSNLIAAVLVPALFGMIACADNPLRPEETGEFGGSEPAGEHGGNERR